MNSAIGNDEHHQSLLRNQLNQLGAGLASIAVGLNLLRDDLAPVLHTDVFAATEDRSPPSISLGVPLADEVAALLEKTEFINQQVAAVRAAVAV
ncbi:hypothetical protein BJP27_24355 (plasmid) [Pseudomonas oryzihabitans]|nr:hypothetical protein BJP27_24355 [Pseudomonas psychrotolerans]